MLILKIFYDLGMPYSVHFAYFRQRELEGAASNIVLHLEEKNMGNYTLDDRF